MQSSSRTRAIELRKQGRTYSEILSEIPVAKSTLSLWLRSVGLSKAQRQTITRKRLDAATRGAASRRKAREVEVIEYIRRGRAHVRKLSVRELWLIGVALYWAEGAKQRESRKSVGIQFSNSDASMHVVFLAWLRLLGVPQTAIAYELYVHETRKDEIQSFKNWWARQLKIRTARIDRVYLKQGKVKTSRKNVGDLYHGLIRIKVARSTVLNRKVNGWIHGIVASLGDGVTGNTSAFGAEDSRFEP